MQLLSCDTLTTVVSSAVDLPFTLLQTAKPTWRHPSLFELIRFRGFSMLLTKIWKAR